MSKELDDLDAPDLDSWTKRKDQAVKELTLEVEAADALQSAANELKNQLAEDKRIAKNAASYQRRKIADKLSEMGHGKQFSKGVAAKWRAAEAAGLHTVDDALVLNWSKVMIWDSDSDRGKAVLDLMADYQAKCCQKVADRSSL